jgi:peroxiredoxin
MRRIRRAVLAVLLASWVASTSGAARAEDDAAARLGQKIANVTLFDTAGKKIALYDLKDKKAVAVVFLSFECPNYTGYSPVLADMARRYSQQGVAFFGVCCTEGETAEAVAQQAEEFKLGFPVYHDEQGAASCCDTAAVSMTPMPRGSRRICRSRAMT